jgi:thiol-disulfide isomerase/thioredoxin
LLKVRSARRPDRSAGRRRARTGGAIQISGTEARFTVEGKATVVKPSAYVLGARNGAALLESNFGYRWRAKGYEPDAAVTSRLRDEKRDVRVLTFFGTWCPHCSRYLPLLLKLEQRLAEGRIRFDYHACRNGDERSPRRRSEDRRRATATCSSAAGGRSIPAVSWSSPELAIDMILHLRVGLAGDRPRSNVGAARFREVLAARSTAATAPRRGFREGPMTTCVRAAAIGLLAARLLSRSGGAEGDHTGRRGRGCRRSRRLSLTGAEAKGHYRDSEELRLRALPLPPSSSCPGSEVFSRRSMRSHLEITTITLFVIGRVSCSVSSSTASTGTTEPDLRQGRRRRRAWSDSAHPSIPERELLRQARQVRTDAERPPSESYGSRPPNRFEDEGWRRWAFGAHVYAKLVHPGHLFSAIRTRRRRQRHARARPGRAPESESRSKSGFDPHEPRWRTSTTRARLRPACASRAWPGARAESPRLVPQSDLADRSTHGTFYGGDSTSTDRWTRPASRLGDPRPREERDRRNSGTT